MIKSILRQLFVEKHMQKYRHEYKYMCDATQNAILKMRARGLLQVDMHAGISGYYDIRSLYFDTWDNQCYFENESGIDRRHKYRVRIYNTEFDKIMLEKKSKVRQMTLKQSCQISKEICQRLMRNERIEITEEMSESQKELLAEMQVKSMRPVVIVEYQRFPFVNKNGNVRITFDENIKSSNDINSFLEKQIRTRPVLGMGQSVLEVKWDEFLPSYIKTHIQMDNLRWSSFSKYYLCRKYNTYGGIKL